MPAFEHRTTKPQTWEFIENRYRTDFSRTHQLMLELVQHIRATGLASRLYAFTSMDKLVVSIDEMIAWRKETLEITYDVNSNHWNFEYYAEPYRDAEFVRTYPREQGIEKFDNFLKMIRW